VPEPEALARRVFPYDGRVKSAANALNRIGYLHPPLLQSNLVRNVADPVSRGSARFGELQFHEQKSGQIELGGQAFLPDKQGPADAVLITYDNAEGEPVICAIVSLEIPRRTQITGRVGPFLAALQMGTDPSEDRLPEGQQCLLKSVVIRRRSLSGLSP
jgi:hypothetical protein